jgi:defect-in-organelle-trafficking protein DotC
LLVIGLLLLSACGASKQPTTVLTVRGGTSNLTELQALAVIPRVQSNDQVTVMRSQLLTDAAMSMGARSALNMRAKQINAILDKHDKQLDRIYNFTGMLLEQHVMPPVLIEAQHTMNLSSDRAIRISDHVYEIKTQARFVTMPVTWRDYLKMAYSEPEKPNPSILPRNSKESMIWKEAVAAGWEKGLQQAEEIYHDNLARLKEDYVGMALYRKLLAQGMVSPPYVVRTALGVTGDKNKLRVNDEVLRITAMPELVPQSQLWKPVVRDE